MRRKAKKLLLLVLVYGFFVIWSLYGGVTSEAEPGCTNAIWLGHRWFAEPRTESEVKELGERLRGCRVLDLYLHTGPVASDGSIPEWDPELWSRNHRLIRRHLRKARLFAWLGALNQEFFGAAPDTLDLKNASALEQMVLEFRKLHRAGFEGLHLDVEPVRDGCPYFLNLLSRCRGGPVVSVATPQLRSPLVPSVPPADRLWSESYYSEVGRRVDQVVLMGYDTLQPTEFLYQRYLTRQVRRLSLLLGPKLVVGVPTYDDNAPYHNPKAENLDTALRSVKLGATDRGPAGVAIYAEWTTDSEEWRELKEF